MNDHNQEANPGMRGEQWQDGQAQVPREGGSGCLKIFLIGCGGLFLLSIVCAILGYVFWTNIVSGVVGSAGNEVIKDLKLTPEEEKESLAVWADFMKQYDEGNIDWADMAEFGQNVQSNPLIFYGQAQIAQRVYVDPSSLSEDEKQSASLEIQRFCRGCFEGQIGQDKAQTALDSVLIDQPGGGKSLKSKITDEELITLLAEIKAINDEAGVVEGEFVIDFSEELRKLLESSFNVTLAPSKDSNQSEEKPEGN